VNRADGIGEIEGKAARARGRATRGRSEFQIRVSPFVWGIPLHEKAGIFHYREKRPRMVLLSLLMPNQSLEFFQFRKNFPIIGASLISTGIIFGRANPRGIEVRFQRLMYQQSDAWGDAPG